MTNICSIGRGIPEYTIEQAEIKEIVQDIFSYSDKQIKRLLPVFDNAAVERRQFVVDKSWFVEEHSFKERNDIYQKAAEKYALAAIDDCLQNPDFLNSAPPYEAIDMIIFVSSTGISTPSMDVHLMNARPFRQDVNRMPLWGLGCAGGAIGLARAHDWITAHPTKTALIICCELCSLTFQKGDSKKSNMVGTALFGDGVSAALAVGDDSPYLSYRKKSVPSITSASSYLKRDSVDVMGWDINNSGFEVVFKKSIPALVDSFWRKHVDTFFHDSGLSVDQIHSFISHPGGRKVMEAMEEVVHCPKDKLKYSYNVLADHGNMSSATVLYVMREWMLQNIKAGEKSILSALGPGFSSELLLLEWNE
ncbi:type III polyketide synthase [Oceanobacillus massiliensis]|uniref:type III polyketide synthase n=1 Tax=Oceanobacillus massiliensis TaxID=1465765 RepID=UPI0002899B21|nr:3-oxoacyl-[acyl-carrier-protein] synthase III C-terminal domain-containing protein [Oceanobacillus massiliensis]